ncbi:hypothetical protein D3C80_1539460 [compost metagenome]
MAMKVENSKPSTLVMLAARDKKAGNWERAVLLWQKAILHSSTKFGTLALEASVELAMYYEHKKKDYVTALGYADGAFEQLLDQAMLARRDAKKCSELEALRNRITRLRRKAANQMNIDIQQ